MTNYYMKPIRAKAFRLTKLDACGKPVAGASNGAVSKGFVKIDFKPQVESGTDYKQKNANDELVINSRGKPIIRWWDLSIDLIGVDPYVYNLLTGAPLIMNDATTPEAIGMAFQSGPIGAPFALETWTDLEGQACSATGDKQYGYAVIPFVVDGYIGDVTYENGSITFPLAGARTSDGNQWGVGPYEVVNTSAGAASKLLAPLGVNDHKQFMLTTVAPPVATVGPVAVPPLA